MAGAKGPPVCRDPNPELPKLDEHELLHHHQCGVAHEAFSRALRVHRPHTWIFQLCKITTALHLIGTRSSERGAPGLTTKGAIGREPNGAPGLAFSRNQRGREANGRRWKESVRPEAARGGRRSWPLVRMRRMDFNLPAAPTTGDRRPVARF